MSLLHSNRLLELVSRSFALCIPRLPDLVRSEVGNYYLLCRYLDSIEDSRLSREQKANAFKRFLGALKKPDEAELEKLNADILPFVISENDREMIASFSHVLAEFQTFDLQSRKIALHWVAVMAKGMNKFSDRKIETFSDLDRYCYYVAGTVGHYLTDLFAYKFGWKKWTELKERCQDFGLLLQKVNIIRDFSKDYSEGRVFWPSKLFEKHHLKVEEAFDQANSEKSKQILEEMIADAKKHSKHSMEYIEQIPAELEGVRMFCAIPLYMALPTLEKCEDNQRIFEKESRVKLNRDETRQIITELEQKIVAKPAEPTV